MYYEEKLIDGVLHWRGTPDGEWQTMSQEMLTNTVLQLREQLSPITRKHFVIQSNANMKKPTPQRIAEMLHSLSIDMAEIANFMGQYRGDAEWSKHSAELRNAASTARQWAYEINDQYHD